MGKRVRTELSVMTPGAGKATAYGCTKNDIAFVMGPRMRQGEAPAMLKGVWILCQPKAGAAEIATLPMGSGVEFEGTVSVKGPKAARRVSFTDTKVVATHPLTMQAPVQ